MSDSKPKPNRGCAFYTLLLSSLLFLIVLAGGLVGLRYFKTMLRDFTSPAASPVPVVTLPPEEMKQLQRRIDTFRNGVRGGTLPAPLELTDQEINALISSDPDLEPFKGKLHLTIRDGNIMGRISAPLDQLNLSVFKGRFLNGDAQFDLSFANSTIRLSPRTITVRGRPIPDIYMETIRRQNLARHLNSDARASAALDRLEQIQVKDNKIILVPKTGLQ